MPLRSSYIISIIIYFFIFFLISFWSDYDNDSVHQWLGLKYLIFLDLGLTAVKCIGTIVFSRTAKYVLLRQYPMLAITILAVGLIVIMYFNQLLLWEYEWSYFLEDFRKPTFTVYSLQEVLIPYGIGISIEVIFEYLKQYNEQQSLKLEKTKAELSFLKAQISPHFLFNTINTIFWLIVKDPKDAQDLLLKLSDMLRYQLYECESDFVPVQKEIDYLTHLCKIQGYRKGKKVQINTNFECQNFNHPVPPLLFLPLVENALKYVSQSEERENYINIFLTEKSNQINFEIVNSTDNSHVELNEDKKYSGIGLSNIRKRLSLIYNDNYTFSTSLINNAYYAKIEF